MDFVEQVRNFGFWNVHTFESNISLIRLFSLMFNYAKPAMICAINIMTAQIITKKHPLTMGKYRRL